MKPITTTDLCNKLGFIVRVSFIESLGFSPVLVKKTSILWDEEDLDGIRQAIIEKLKLDMSNSKSTGERA